MTPVLDSPTEFRRRYLMGRTGFNPRDFGVNMDKDAFVDMIVDAFNEFIKDEFSLDEMLLRPRLALQFCDFARNRFRFWDMPDDILLRSVMYRRKNP